MDLVSEISHSHRIINVDSESRNSHEKYVFRQEIAAYCNHNTEFQNSKLPKRYQFLIDENPSLRGCNLNCNNINQSINDDLQGMTTRTISPASPLNHSQPSNQKVINLEQVSFSRSPVWSGGSPLKMTSQYREDPRDRTFAEKTTYCRPAVDVYSKQFMYKTIQRNARLQSLVKRLVLVREKEKKRVAWNNYINDLRNKYKPYKNPPNRTPSVSPDPNNPDTDYIDYYESSSAGTKSGPGQNLLQDYYSASSKVHENFQYPTTPILSPTLISNRPNYETSSRGYGIINQELPQYDYPNYTLPWYDYAKLTPPPRAPILVDKEVNPPSWSKQSLKRRHSRKLSDINKLSKIRHLSVQTETSLVTQDSDKDLSLFKDKYNQISNNVERLKQKLKVSEVEVKYGQLTQIDKKLDDLIHSINNFINEIKTQKTLINNTSEREAINQTQSTSFLKHSEVRRAEITCKVQDRAISNLELSKGNHQETLLYEILKEEMHKSDKAKRDIENLINKPSKSYSNVHITFDIPTKDGTIEIKDQFKVDPRSVCVEQVNCQEKRMTIAVNTDPLGLLALFRVSAEAVKQLLSFMPQIDYYSYLSRLPLPANKESICHYVCNICGAAFNRPSQLSDHIQLHSSGKTRDCCVCRHVLDSTRQSGLFTCRHCGQRFTRAYCRELHQLSCARLLDKRADTTSSLIILR